MSDSPAPKTPYDLFLETLPDEESKRRFAEMASERKLGKNDDLFFLLCALNTMFKLTPERMREIILASSEETRAAVTAVQRFVAELGTLRGLVTDELGGLKAASAEARESLGYLVSGSKLLDETATEVKRVRGKLFTSVVATAVLCFALGAGVVALLTFGWVRQAAQASAVKPLELIYSVGVLEDWQAQYGLSTRLWAIPYEGTSTLHSHLYEISGRLPTRIHLYDGSVRLEYSKDAPAPGDRLIDDQRSLKQP